MGRTSGHQRGDPTAAYGENPMAAVSKSVMRCAAPPRDSWGATRRLTTGVLIECDGKARSEAFGSCMIGLMISSSLSVAGRSGALSVSRRAGMLTVLHVRPARLTRGAPAVFLQLTIGVLRATCVLNPRATCSRPSLSRTMLPAASDRPLESSHCSVLTFRIE